MRKRFFFLIILIFIAGLFFLQSAVAEKSGNCGFGCNWRLDDNGVLTISGTGEMSSYSEPYQYPWYSDYHTDDKGVLVINLSNGSGKMIFSYDAVRHTGTVSYPGQTRVEKAWAVTPTPESTATPKSTKREDAVTSSPSNSSDKYSNDYITQLIKKGLDGTLTPSEATNLDDWYRNH